MNDLITPRDPRWFRAVIAFERDCRLKEAEDDKYSYLKDEERADRVADKQTDEDRFGMGREFA